MKTTSILYFFLFALCANFITPAAKAQVNKKDSLALVELFDSTDGYSWYVNANWLSKKPVSSWYGVHVDSSRVISLNLGFDQLNGTIPSSIGNLAKLNFLSLSGNHTLSGLIPATIGNLLSLDTLELNYDDLSGSIPSSIGNLTQLIDLGLSSNRFTGAMPSTIGKLTNLQNFMLDYNQLSGAIPSSIGNLTKLENLHFENNQLSSIPSTIGKLTNLKYMNLENNQLSGTIPSSIGNLTNLIILLLYENKLTGTIPASIGNLVLLNTLALGNNQLSGVIPPTISKLTNLQGLELENNQLSDAIPSSIGKLKQLFYLYLNNNQLTGKIPYAIGNLEYLLQLYINNNQLSGAIPSSIGKLTHLQYLNLSHNQLSGKIPYSVGNIKYPYSIDLSYNQLTGDIPLSARKLYPAHYVYLSHNHLSESINIYSDSFYNPHLSGDISYNNENFNGLELLNKQRNVVYAPQANITINQNDNTLYVSAGGTPGNNTYFWFKTGTKDSTTINGDSTFTPSSSGKYYVKVHNKLATQLTLYSDTIDFSTHQMKQSNSALTAKATSSVTVITHMQIYPNPATNIIYIQTAGTAIITFTNSAGKTLLTKTINNTDAINVSTFANGVYYIKNKTTGEMQKVVVVH